MPPAVFWLVILVIFVVVEALTVGLVSIWFAAGALAALLVSLAVENVWVQIVVFLAVSAMCLGAMRPLLRSYLGPARRQATNADRLIGAEGIVTEAIDNVAASGAVQVKGQTWTARSAGGEAIPPEARVRVLRIEGVKLFVELADASAGPAEQN